MKIPEGWPTKEMKQTGAMEMWRRFDLAGTQRDIGEVFKAMLAAAPTPPAQDSVKLPTTTDEAELMAKLGMMWLEQNAPDRLKTPPAHEDEPVGYVSAGAMKSLGDKESDGQTIFPRKGMIYNIPLYTRPSSELRKAAEEAHTLLVEIDKQVSLTESACEVMDNLHAALERK